MPPPGSSGAALRRRPYDRFLPVHAARALRGRCDVEPYFRAMIWLGRTDLRLRARPSAPAGRRRCSSAVSSRRRCVLAESTDGGERLAAGIDGRRAARVRRRVGQHDGARLRDARDGVGAASPAALAALRRGARAGHHRRRLRDPAHREPGPLRAAERPERAARPGVPAVRPALHPRLGGAVERRVRSRAARDGPGPHVAQPARRRVRGARQHARGAPPRDRAREVPELSDGAPSRAARRGRARAGVLGRQPLPRLARRAARDVAGRRPHGRGGAGTPHGRQDRGVVAARVLDAQLASWAELRHDTLLYAKQSYSLFPTCEYPDAYVDPYPALWAELAHYAARGAALAAKLPAATSDFRGRVLHRARHRGGAAARHGRQAADRRAVRRRRARVGQRGRHDQGRPAAGCTIAQVPDGWYVRLFFNSATPRRRRPRSPTCTPIRPTARCSTSRRASRGSLVVTAERPAPGRAPTWASRRRTTRRSRRGCSASPTWIGRPRSCSQRRRRTSPGRPI